MKSKNQKGNNKKEEAPEVEEEVKEEEEVSDDHVGRNNNDDNDDDSDSSESDDDGELGLEGEIVRNSDDSSSSSDDDEDDDDTGENDDDDDDDDDEEKKPSAKDSKDTKRKSPPTNKEESKSKKKKKKKRARKEDDDLDKVEFIFCEMDEKKYWDGCKALLINASSVYQKHASIWTDWLMEQVLGTVVSTSEAYSAEDNLVFGFASLIGLQKKKASTATTDEATAQREQALGFLQKYAMDDCPTEYRSDMKKLFESSQSCPLYVFLHGRMMNLPLEIVLVLHQQLWLDWEYAQKDGNDDGSADGKNKKKKAKKKTAAAASAQPTSVFSDKEPRILRVAPCTKSNDDNMIIYRYYDDELLAGRAMVSYTVKAPPSYSKEQAQFLQVLLFTPENYQQAIQDLEALVGS